MYEWAEFRHFKYLLTILELQGFRAAAEQLNTAQPNLSAQAKQFQENADVRLYARTKGNRIKPTDTGLAFQFIAKSVLEARDEALDALIAIDRGDITSVKLGCSPLVDQAVFRDMCKMHRELLASIEIHPECADTIQLVDDVRNGALDAALVTLPLIDAALKIELLRQDHLVVCLRKDDPLALGSLIKPSDLKRHLSIFYDPRRHPEAHARLVELLADIGIDSDRYSRASHPSEMQILVREGYGVALLREGTSLLSDLTTRPIAGVRWTVDTALIYHRKRHPKTIPVLARRFKRQFGKDRKVQIGDQNPPYIPDKDRPVQLELLS